MGGGNCLKYLKRGGTKNRTEDKKILLRKGGGQAGSRGGSVSIQVTQFFMVQLCAASKLSTSAMPTMINTIVAAADEQ